MIGYTEGMGRLMRRLFDSLKEDDRRRYAAIEAAKLGHGGVEYIATALGCDPKTIRLGLTELEGEAELVTGRTRKRGRAQAADRDRPGDRGQLPQGARGSHRGRSHAARCAMDQPVAAADRRAGHRVGHPRQPPRRPATPPQAPIPPAEGAEEADDGPTPSRSQRAVREHRPAPARVPGGRPCPSSASARRRRS
jgi:hypothetical protein